MRGQSALGQDDKNMNAKVSVIIPIYNVAPYLARALDSLIYQTIGNLEIICIDDASTDGGGDILDAYAAGNKNIIVIKFPKNRGVSAARNAGLERAGGKYVGFLDPDDYLDRNFYAELFAAANTADADMAMGNVYYKSRDQTGTRDDLMARVANNKFEFMYCWWAAIYRRQMLDDNDIKFPDGIICGQDFVFLNRAVVAANAVRVVPGTFYHYEMRENSAFSAALSGEKIDSQLRARAMLLEFMNAQDLREEDYMIVWLAMLKNFLAQLFERNSNKQTRRLVVRGAIDFYWNAKFRTAAVMNIRRLNDNLYRFFESRDADGLLEYLIENEKEHTKNQIVEIKWVRIFGLLPFIKIESFNTKSRRVRLFGLVTVYNILVREEKAAFQI
ncbi:MAG: glycosyltransferase [Rickettsiales bacterium]|nr:glycosyltransferase [Rickettsiales bacterium]